MKDCQMKILAYGATDRGMKREINEDSFRICPEMRLYLVADGMGGHAAGDVASTMAVNSIADYMFDLINQDTHDESPDYSKILVEALQYANNQIIRETHHKNSLRGMGTTLVAVLNRDDMLYIASVGDSRLYLIRDGNIGLLTNDHSWVNMQVQLGHITSEESKQHPMRNVITRALGTQKKVDVDIRERSVETNDYLVLCTDGLSNMLTDKEIASTVLQYNNDLGSAADELIKTSNTRGGDDNITVVLLKFLNNNCNHEFYSQDTEVMCIRPIRPGIKPKET
jgi:PPM family protein phosphatase